MRESDRFDPYAGNLLTARLSPILSREEALQKLIELPPRPKTLGDIPRHIRVRHLMRVRDFHVPQQVEGRLFETLDLMLREGYRYRDPASSSTWGMLSGDAPVRKRPGSLAFGSAVDGASGSGKTEAVLRCLGCLSPRQVIVHDTFPKLIGPHAQLVWLSVDVPASGTSEDFVRSLMLATDQALGSSRFVDTLARDRLKNPMKELEAWKQFAMAHFLGLLNLDEVQNFFKIGTLEQRRKRAPGDGPPELSIKEDQLLKWVLTQMNSGGLPIAVSGTPDGVGALTRRFSNLQRFGTGGYHTIPLFKSWDQWEFKDTFLKALGAYQYAAKPIVLDDALAKLVFELTGGVPRIIIALWIGANRIALERPSDDLMLSDFAAAFDAFLAPLAPAVAAIRSGEPNRMARYEDLVAQDPSFWTRCWDAIASK